MWREVWFWEEAKDAVLLCAQRWQATEGHESHSSSILCRDRYVGEEGKTVADERWVTEIAGVFNWLMILAL